MTPVSAKGVAEIHRRRPWLVLVASVGFVCSCSNLRDSEGKTALYRAAEEGNLQQVRELVEAGAALDSRNAYPEGTSFLVKLLPGTRHLAGLSPLHIASEKRHIDVVKYLILNGAEVNVRDYQARTPLSLVAASHGDMEIVTLLVEGGADVDPVDSRGYTPLIHAARLGNTGLVRYLLSKGALADRWTRDGRTALLFAADDGRAEIASLLLAKGADPNETLGNVQPPLQVAVLKGDDEVVRELLEAGADPNLHAPGTTDLLVAAAYEGFFKTVALLLEHGANVDAASGGYTAAHHAAAKNYADIISVLILFGADLEKTDEEANRTPLQIAVEGNHVETVRELLDGGADPNADVSTYTPPLIRAARNGNLEIVELLVNHGADVNIRDGEWTPLHFAEYGNHQAVVQLLREHGATKE
jgi:ankyrin repeat protein